ncbi:hypothetical protein Bca4012_026608 [Brassica carinata]
MEADSSLRRDLTAANRVIDEHKDKFRVMANMSDLMLETNPNRVLPLRGRLYVRPLSPTPPQKSRRIRSDGRISTVPIFFDDINLNVFADPTESETHKEKMRQAEENGQMEETAILMVRASLVAESDKHKVEQEPVTPERVTSTLRLGPSASQQNLGKSSEGKDQQSNS